MHTTTSTKQRHHLHGHDQNFRVNSTHVSTVPQNICVERSNMQLLQQPDKEGTLTSEEANDVQLGPASARHAVCALVSLPQESQLSEAQLGDKIRFCHASALKWLQLNQPEQAEVSNLDFARNLMLE